MMKKLHAQIWWALQYPAWWIAPDSLFFSQVRAKYSRVVLDWMNSKLSREEAIKRLKELNSLSSPADAHAIADDVLCNLLKSLGYQDVVAEWENIDKWYS